MNKVLANIGSSEEAYRRAVAVLLAALVGIEALRGVAETFRKVSIDGPVTVSQIQWPVEVTIVK